MQIGNLKLRLYGTVEDHGAEQHCRSGKQSGQYQPGL
jgi:hypothetical protein